MKVGLFIPCYMDLFQPQAAIATLKLLERQGVEVEYPAAQTCCGQPMLNAGCVDDAVPAAEHFVRTFADYDYVICPSGSCTAMVRHHYAALVHGADAAQVCGRVRELCEFLVDVLRVERIDAHFPHRIGLHQACHGLRELRLGRSSERMEAPYSKIRKLLDHVSGLTIVDLERPDECCGFGGTFAVSEPAVSVAMGRDRIADHQRAGAEFIVSGDTSCLLHLEGVLRRQRADTRVLHVAQVLTAGTDAG